MMDWAETLYEEALSLWGKDAQIDMIVEECAELILAIQKFRRSGDASGVIEELADVQIMLEQANLIFSRKSISKTYKDKLLRLASRIELDKINRAAMR